MSREPVSLTPEQFAGARVRSKDRGELRRALRPFVEAFRKRETPGDSDLDNEQPYDIRVTLGDCRRAERALDE